MLTEKNKHFNEPTWFVNHKTKDLFQFGTYYMESIKRNLNCTPIRHIFTVHTNITLYMEVISYLQSVCFAINIVQRRLLLSGNKYNA